MRIYYLFAGRFPGEKGAALFAAKSVEAFSRLGYESFVLAPRRFGRALGSAREYFNLSEHIQAVYLPTFDLGRTPLFGAISFRLGLFFYGISCYFWLKSSSRTEDLLISNEALPLIFASYAIKNTCYEVHDYPEKNRWMYRLLFKRVAHILVTNRLKLKELARAFPESSSKMFYEPNATDIDAGSGSSKREAREALGLPVEGTIVVYTGQLFSWKGADTLAQAASRLSEGISVYFVGGVEEELAVFREKFGDDDRIQIVGQRPYAQMPLWQRAADVLVLPNTAKEKISAEYTSPMKLFMYMAAGRPIVATRIPALTEILTEDMAVLVDPDDPDALAAGIRSALDSEAMSSKVEASYAWIRTHDWHSRAKRIVDRLVS